MEGKFGKCFLILSYKYRTTVRLAQALAKSEKATLADKHFDRTIAVTSPFSEEMRQKSESDERKLRMLEYVPYLAVSTAIVAGAILGLKM